jgi:RHS repeat-associated protein
LNAPSQVLDSDAGRIRLPQPGDGNAMGTYVESYEYDAVGNLLSFLHQTSSGNWRRRYAYEETSAIESGVASNRLTATSLPGDADAGPYTGRYHYDAHGNAVDMPHLSSMTWNERDSLRSTAKQVVNSGTPETTYYRYDLADHRLCKVTDRASSSGPGTRRTERIYLGATEIYREYAADGVTLTLSRETLVLMADRKVVAHLDRRTAGTDPAPARALKYHYANLIDSAALELDEVARIVSYEEYYPYGSTSYQAVASQTDTPKRLRWSGKQRDDESGFYYSQARYYAPWLGRWFNPDPEGISDGPNVYLYVHANPITVVDPTGTIGLVLGGLTAEGAALLFGAACGTVIIATHPPRIPPFQPFAESDDDFPTPPSAPPVEEPVPAPPPPAPAPPAPAPGWPNPWPPYPGTPPVMPQPWAPPVPVPWIPPIPVPWAPTLPFPPEGPDMPPIPPIGPIPQPPTSGPRVDTKPKTDTTPKTDTKPKPKTDAPPRTKPDEKKRRRRKKNPLRYVTYTKKKKVKGKTLVYAGYARGYGDPRAIVAGRDRNHHMKGFDAAKLDQSLDAKLPWALRHQDPSYQAIRGREQQLADKYGGAVKDPKRRPNATSANTNRPVAATNKRRHIYDTQATLHFGRIAPYTGNP